MLLGSSSKVPFNTDFTFGPFLFSFNIFARRPHYPMIQYLSPVCRRYQDLLTSVKQNKTDFNCFLDIKILECKELYPQTASSWTPAGSRAFTETALHWIWSVLSLIKRVLWECVSTLWSHYLVWLEMQQNIPVTTPVSDAGCDQRAKQI